MHLPSLAPLLLAFTLVVPGPGRSSVTTRVSTPARLTVGDRFDLTLAVTSPSRSLVLGPLADSLGVFAVADEKRRTAVRAGSATTTYRLRVAGFQPGRHRLPVFTFLVQAGATTDTLRSDTGSVTIASVLPAQMKDIHPLKPAESFPNHGLWMVPALLGVLALLAWAGRRLVRRYRRLQEQGVAPLPPWEEALQQLDTMPWHEWLEAGQFKRYYYRLSEVLKRYIERRFEFEAAEQTTTEMLAAMRAHRTPLRDEVARFFLRSDLVKYSKAIPPGDEARRAIEEVREFVTRTMPREPAPVPAGDGAGPAARESA